MNEMELFFVRENLKWNIQYYILIGILVVIGICFIITIIENIKNRIIEYLEKKKKQ